MNIKPFIGAALVGAVIWAANASATNLNVALYNPNQPGTNSYVVDLNVSFDDLASGANTGFTSNVIDTIFADIGTDLGTLANYEYSVFAVGEVLIPEFGGFTTGAVISGSNSPGYRIPTEAALTGVTNNANTYLGAQDFQNFTSENEPGTPGFYEAITFNGSFGNQVLPAEAVAGVPVTAFLPVYTGDFLDSVFNFELVDIGEFLLDVDGTFTYSTDPVTVIPVPAAVWLFGSALIGGVARYGRRRNAESA